MLTNFLFIKYDHYCSKELYHQLYLVLYTMKKFALKQVSKTTFKVLFFMLCFWCSYSSVKDFFEGKILFDTINEYNEKMIFPSVTICPKRQNFLPFLNISKIVSENEGLTYKNLKGPNFISTMRALKKPMEFVKIYSYRTEEIFIKDISFFM